MNNNPDDLLSFKEFAPVHGSFNSNNNNNPPTAQISINSPQRTTTTNTSGGFGNNNSDPLDDLINDMSRSVRVLDEGNNLPSGNSAKLSINDDDEDVPAKSLTPLNIEFYQQFFNVDTLMVIDRIATSMIPKRAPQNYLKSNIGMNPDLYGPFWITVTLIFSIAISGNISNYLQYENESYHWHYNFHLVSYAATAIFIYSSFLPGALWGVFKWSLKPNDDDLETESASYTPSLMSLMCVYGYSLAIYIPVSILWAIQYAPLQWILMITATFLSGSVLILVMTPALRNSKYSLFVIIAVIVSHFLLAAGFMLYFFHIPSPTISEKIIVADVPKLPIKNVSNLLTNQTVI